MRCQHGNTGPREESCPFEAKVEVVSDRFDEADYQLCESHGATFVGYGWRASHYDGLELGEDADGDQVWA